MDTLTHALSGALLARATASKDAPPNSLPRRIAAGFFACAAPDLDFVAGFAGPEFFLLNHRGVTHSLLLLPAWAFVLAWILARLLREPRGWRALYSVCAMSVGLHIAGDLITSYGTMILAPLSDWRAGIGTTFIIDLWFSGIIVAGLIASIFFQRTRIPAIAAFASLVAYVGFQYVQRERALDFGTEYVKQKGLQGVTVSVHPKPVSPFNWTVFVSDDRVHRFAHVNLERKEPRRYQPGDGFVARVDSPYMPLEQAIWVTRTRYGEVDEARHRQAWNSDALAFFRWFAALPALDAVTEGGRCVWFVDLRFLTPGRDAMPFQVGVCSEAGAWRAHERSG